MHRSNTERREETADYVVQDGAKNMLFTHIKCQQANVGILSFPAHLTCFVQKLTHLYKYYNITSLVIEVSRCKNEVSRISFWSAWHPKLHDSKVIFHKMALSLAVPITDSNLWRGNINNIRDKIRLQFEGVRVPPHGNKDASLN